MTKEIIITANDKWWKISFRELWEFRELLYVFAWRDIKVRYKQTFIGILWVIIQPIITTGIFSVFFGKIAKLPSDGLPYPLFVLIGLIIWIFFSNGITSASQSIITTESIIKKVYFPRLIIPLASLATASVDFVITLILLIIAMIYWGYYPDIRAIYIFPLALIILYLTSAGIGFFSSALNVKFRDVKYALPFFVQIGMFVTPVIYPLSAVYDYRRIILILNPLTIVIESIRTVIAHGVLDWTNMTIGLVMSILIFAVGLFYFKKTEAFFADII